MKLFLIRYTKIAFISLRLHKIFNPSIQDIQWATKVVQALDNAQKNLASGAVKLEGKMIDAVHYKQAKRILDSAK